MMNILFYLVLTVGLVFMFGYFPLYRAYQDMKTDWHERHVCLTCGHHVKSISQVGSVSFNFGSSFCPKCGSYLDTAEATALILAKRKADSKLFDAINGRSWKISWVAKSDKFDPNSPEVPFDEVLQHQRKRK